MNVDISSINSLTYISVNMGLHTMSQKAGIADKDRNMDAKYFRL